MKWQNHITQHIVTGDGGKESVYFAFPKWIEEKARTKEDKKLKKPATFGPVIISKRTFNMVLTQIHDLTSGYMTENYDKLLRYSEKNLASGISVFIKEMQMEEDKREIVEEFVKDAEGNDTEELYTPEPRDPQVFRSLLRFMDYTIQELDKKESTANPLREALNILAKSSKYVDLDFTDPAKIMESWKAAEIARIEGIYQKGLEVTQDTFKSYVAEKFKDNGVDEDGYLRLKAKSEDKPKPEEKKAE